MKWILLFSVFLLLLTGALGLKTTKDCDREERISQRVQCYHTAAITAAYLGDSGLATSICDDIWLRFGKPLPEKDDHRKKARLVSNSCFYDVAKIARDSTICDSIEEEEGVGTKLFGEKVSLNTCINETQRLAQIAPENYYRDNEENLCAMVFIIPFLVFSVLGIRGGRP